MNVLITSVSRKVSWVRAFQRALADEGGGKVIAVDMSPLAPALYLADEHYLVPPSRAPEFLEVMLRLCEQLEIGLIIPSRDEELPFFARHRKRFSDVGSLVMVTDPTTVKTCQDKKLFIEFCRKHDFGIPKTYDSGSISTSVDFPLFVKPQYGKGGWRTTRVDSRDHLRLALEQGPGAIVQEFVEAKEYTIDLFADFSSRVLSVVPRERVRILGGESFVGRTSSNPVLIQKAIQLATELGLVGHNTIQCFLEDGSNVKFIEVNPRFGGGANLGFAAGAPTPLFLVRLLKGKELEPSIGEFKDGYIMLRYTEDLFLDSECLTDRTFQ